MSECFHNLISVQTGINDVHSLLPKSGDILPILRTKARNSLLKISRSEKKKTFK